MLIVYRASSRQLLPIKGNERQGYIELYRDGNKETDTGEGRQRKRDTERDGRDLRWDRVRQRVETKRMRETVRDTEKRKDSVCVCDQ